jgi:hypothetical protein
MAAIAFAVHLSGNFYLDSHGNRSKTRPKKRPFTIRRFSCRVAPSKVKDALDSVKKALKDVDKDADVIKKFEDFGLPLKMLDILSGVGRIAGMLGMALY